MFNKIVAVAVVMVVSSVAGAGMLVGDPAAMLSGSQSFVSDNMQAVVDYAVYAPGSFGDILTPDPSGGSEYVYAYQIIPTDTLPVTFLTIGLSVPADNAVAAPLWGLTGGIPATAWTIQSQGVAAAFLAPELQAPYYSRVLIFTSRYAPGFASASVGNGGKSDQQTLPSPIPEPGSLALATLAIGALLRRSR